MQTEAFIPSVRGRRAFLVGIQLPSRAAFEVDDHLDELEELASSAVATVVGRAVQTRLEPHPATFVGRGKSREIAAAADELGSDLIIFDDDLSPGQVRNLEQLLGRSVLDRSALILEIFRQHARTREARTQVELAQLSYLLPRLTRRWGHLSRQEGGIGVRGGEGEKQLEMDRRSLRRRIRRLKSDLQRIARTREVQRRARRGICEVALAGYTNVGKTTLFNLLTRAGAEVGDRLFATLDPRLRRGSVGAGEVVVFADTVGLIRKLPHHLVASFKSTLEEVAFADLVLNVVDRSHPQWQEQMRVSDGVLRQLGVADHSVLTVMNKVDRVAPFVRRQSAVPWVSAITGEGVEELRQTIRSLLRQPREARELREMSPARW